MESKKINFNHPFVLESGKTLPSLEIAYTIQGNPITQPVVWVCHALTGNQFVNDWWPGLFGEEQLFNAEEYCIICANVLGSAYGSTGPLNLSNGMEYSHSNFPEITTKDMVKAHQILANELGIASLSILIGASIGGQQAIEWANQKSIPIENLILIATNAKHSPFGIAFNEAQRLAIRADLTFGRSTDTAGEEGLKAARAIAMLSYRSYSDYESKRNDPFHVEPGNYAAASYVRYQGEKLAKRFNAYSYYRLSQAMDSHDISRGTEYSLEENLNQITAKTLVIGIQSDLLFPPKEQRLLALNIPNAQYAELQSSFGHDAFLIEFDWLKITLNNFLKNNLIKEIKTNFTTLKRNRV